MYLLVSLLPFWFSESKQLKLQAFEASACQNHESLILFKAVVQGIDYEEDIQTFGMNMTSMSSSEVKNTRFAISCCNPRDDGKYKMIAIIKID